MLSELQQKLASVPPSLGHLKAEGEIEYEPNSSDDTITSSHLKPPTQAKPLLRRSKGSCGDGISELGEDIVKEPFYTCISYLLPWYTSNHNECNDEELSSDLPSLVRSDLKLFPPSLDLFSNSFVHSFSFGLRG